MGGESDLSNIEKFNGEGFAMWKFMMQAILRSKELMSIVDGSKVKPVPVTRPDATPKVIAQDTTATRPLEFCVKPLTKSC